MGMDAHSVAASSSHMTSMSLQLRERLSVLPSSAGERMYTGSSAVSVSGLSSAASVETVLSTKPPLPKSASTSLSSLGTSSAEATIPSSPSTQSLRPPTVEEESQSDTSSLGSELEKKTKKKRSFFTFRRKKEKIP